MPRYAHATTYGGKIEFRLGLPRRAAVRARGPARNDSEPCFERDAVSKPTPKRIGLLRWIRDFANEAEGVPCYTSMLCAHPMRLSQYYLSDEDSRVLLAAHRSGLIRFKDDKECFSFLTDEGKALLEKYKDLYPQIPGEYGERPRLSQCGDKGEQHG